MLLDQVTHRAEELATAQFDKSVTRFRTVVLHATAKASEASQIAALTLVIHNSDTFGAAVPTFNSVHSCDFKASSEHTVQL